MSKELYKQNDNKKEVLKLVEDCTSGVPVEKIRTLYEAWAETYDKDHDMLAENRLRYVGKYLVKYVSAENQPRILDVAAGTGRLGLELKKQGFLNLDALDASPAMLEQAKQKGCYKNFMCDVFGKNRLNIEEDTYDAVVTTASFAPSHVSDDCFEELLRITKPGGYFLLVMRHLYFKTAPEFSSKLELRMRHLEDRGAWKWLLKDEVSQYMEDEDGFAYVFQILHGKREYLASI